MKSLRFALMLSVVCVVVSAQGPGDSTLPPFNPAYPSPLVKEGATIQVAPHTYVILDDNIPQVPNVGFVVGSRATLIIDPGMGRRNGEVVLREALKLSNNTEMYVATTHYHIEHTLGYLAMPNARYINSNVQEEEFAQSWQQAKISNASRGPVQTQLLQDATGRKADITFDREYTLDLGGIQIKMTEVGPTHTRGDTILYVIEDEVLFGGDVAMSDTFLIATDVTSMKAWMVAFDLVEQIRPKVIVPSHGKLGDVSLVASSRMLMQEIQSRAVALKAQGHSIDEVAVTVQKEMLAKYPTYPRANGLAPAARAAYREAP